MLESNNPKLELVNYYANTSLFALQSLRRYGRLDEMNLLSVGTRVAHLADYLAMFRSVHHNTMVEVSLPVRPDELSSQLVLHQGDFFALPRLAVDCVISHATFHCMTDTRYGNDRGDEVSAKPYRAAEKLREVVGPGKVPAVISIAVHREEGLYNDNTHLGHEKFVRSFEAAGFALVDYFFDYVCGGIEQRTEYLEASYRRSKVLPPTPTAPREWVVGNYYFE